MCFRTVLRTALVAAAVASSSPLAARPGLPESPDRPSSAAEVLARAKAAAGGSAWDRLRSLHTVATIATGGLEGTVESWDDLRTGRGVTRFELGPLSGAEGWDGEVLWSQDRSGQVRREEGADEVLGAADDAYRRCRGYWFPDRWPAEITSAGAETDDGRTFRVVAVAPRNGRPFSIWVDAASGLVSRFVEASALQTTTTTLSDYRRVGDVLIPFSVRRSNGDSRYDQVVTVQRVELDQALADELFRMPPPPPPDYRFASGAASTAVPFDLVNNHIYVDVRLNGRGPFRMICDTGGMNVVTPTLAAELGLEPQGAVQGRGVGEASEDVGFVPVGTLTVGGVTLDDQLFAVFPLERMADVEGVPLDGLVGYEVFKRFVVRVDYQHRHLTLYEPDHFRYDGTGTVVPFTFAEHLPRIEGSIDGIPGAFDLDTGSRSSLTLLAPFVERHGLHRRSGIETVTGWGVGGPARGRLLRMGSLRLGDVEIPDVVADLSRQRAGAFTDPYLAGNVGGGLLKRFNLVFDYGARTVVFEPNPDAADHDVWDRSGMWLNRSGDVLEIMDVTAGGPAAAAGLAPGDLVLAVDGAPAAEVGLVPLRRRFAADPPGTRVRLRVRRGDTEREVVLVLRDLV